MSTHLIIVILCFGILYLLSKTKYKFFISSLHAKIYSCISFCVVFKSPTARCNLVVIYLWLSHSNENVNGDGRTWAHIAGSIKQYIALLTVLLYTATPVEPLYRGTFYIHVVHFPKECGCAYEFLSRLSPPNSLLGFSKPCLNLTNQIWRI